MQTLYVVIWHETVFDRIYEVSHRETVIGRGSETGLRLPDLSISREHAILTYDTKGVSIQDLKSLNGTQVNGRAIDGMQPINDRSHIELGAYRLAVCFSMADAIRVSASFVDASTRPHDENRDFRRNVNLYLAKLTPAQRRVYDGFVQGFSEKEVAASLSISIHTVHNHAKAIYRILSVSSRGELLADWAKQGIRRPDSDGGS